MPRRTVCTILFSLSSLAACGSDTSSTASASTSLNGCSAANAVTSTTVTVQDYSFAPTCVKVSAGSSLTYVNKGATSHTVTSDAGAPNTFNNTVFDPNDTVTQPFVNAGANGVHCDYHAQMMMTVIVE